ncbi:MAG: hypothetical protein GY795_00835 [Desulfobacterales bacterium]|nr:hypothetical protein [Desulfobacterales bacterium]
MKIEESELKSWIVKILSSEHDDNAIGTGFWVGDGTYVLTCYHVVKGLEEIWISYEGEKTSAKLIKVYLDIALIQAEELSGNAAPLGTKWKREDTIYSVGYQYDGTGIADYPIKGKIAGSTTMDGMEVIIIKDADGINRGASGAPALNRLTGEVIGIISHKRKEKEALAIAIHQALDNFQLIDKQKTRKGMKQQESNYLDNPNTSVNLVAVFLSLFILLGICYIGRNALFTLLEHHSRESGVLITEIVFAIVSLFAALILFGVLHSKGIFKEKTKQGMYEFGGAAAGFLMFFLSFNGMYLLHTQAVRLKINGSVHFVKKGGRVGPVANAKIGLVGIPNVGTKTDESGNFDFELSENQKLQEIEFIVTYDETKSPYYHTVKRSELENIIIEIELTDNTLKIIGSVHFVKKGVRVGPVANAKIGLLAIPNVETKTNAGGNFNFEFPDNQKLQKIDIMVVYDETKPPHYHTVLHSNLVNIIIEIEKPTCEILGAWEYNDKDFPEKWIIVQEDNKITITTESTNKFQYIVDQSRGKGEYSSDDFSASFQVLMIGKTYETYKFKGEINEDNPNIISGRWNFLGKSDMASLKRISE